MTVTAPYRIAPSLEALSVEIDSLQPWPGNPRRGSVEKLQLSLRRWGQTKPILVQQSSSRIVAGNHLWHAAKAEEWTHIAASIVDMPDTEAEAYLLADNQLSDSSTNDPEALTAWLASLQSRGAIDDALGFSSQELDTFLAGVGGTETSADDVPDLPEREATYVAPGDLYQLGPHRVLCGDATDPAAYARLLGDTEAGMVWTDPPYGVGYYGKTAERLEIRGDERDDHGRAEMQSELAALLGNGEDVDRLEQLLRSSFTAALEHVRPGGAVYCSAPGGDRAPVFYRVLMDLGVYRQTVIWVKDVFVMGRSDYHWRHEPLHVGVNGEAETKKRKTQKAGTPIHYGWRPGAAHYFVDDRTLDTVWEIPRPKASRDHPTMKPVELVERSITSSSKRGDTILDPFAGSGTTLLAAERTGRIGAVIELEPRYAQVCVERWETYTGQKAVRV